MIKKQAKLMLGDNMESLKKLPDNSIDSIVTDPPYGLSFMDKKWDYDVPSVEFWKEVYRVLKPGGHILSFGGTRTYHRMVVNIEDAGFEIRDQVMWLYGSGFPKSHNIGKAVDKIEGNERVEWLDEKKTQPNIRGNGDQLLISASGVEVKDREPIKHSKGQSKYEGWGTALKPANEPICVARKPLSEKTIAENVIKWGTGGINIDGCRISIDGEDDRIAGRRTCNIFDEIKVSGGIDSPAYIPSPEGRFPANIILECICDKVIQGKKGEIVERNKNITHNMFGKRIMGDSYSGTGDIHTNPDCVCYQLDEQSGISKSTDGIRKLGDYDNNSGFGKYKESKGHNDKGGASRFFYQAKVSKKERNLGLDNFEETTSGGKGHGLDRRCSHCNTSMLKPEDCKCDEPDWITPPKKNTHPTLKPINLMTYLCRLVTPEGGIVLDPFMGSGSTGISALLEGFRFVGMEMDGDYFKIAEARIAAYEEYRSLLK